MSRNKVTGEKSSTKAERHNTKAADAAARNPSPQADARWDAAFAHMHKSYTRWGVKH